MPFTAKVVTAAEWGARPPEPGTFPFQRTIPRYVIVHHTDNPNPPNDASRGTIEGALRLARNIQTSHMDERGWSDSGHNFLNTTGGFVLEGRHGSLDAVKQGFCIQSAHAKQDPGKLANGNQSPGIENEGNFMIFQIGQKQAIVLGAITITSNDPDGKEITTAFLVAAFAPKAVKFFAERA